MVKEKVVTEEDDMIIIDDAPVDKAASQYPLFFKSPHPLDAERHKFAGLNRSTDAFFAKEVNSIPVHALEFSEVARQYPIVTAAGKEPVALAMVGIGQRNCFIDDNGQWLANAYVPAYVRKYPFTLMHIVDLDQFALCVDEGAEGYAEEDPQMRFYEEDGKPSDMTSQALEFCGQYQKCHSLTVEFLTAMQQAGLLQEKEVKVKSPTGQESRLGGFHVINEDAWRALDNDIYLQWRQKGWVDLVQIMLMSQVNWRYLSAE